MKIKVLKNKNLVKNINFRNNQSYIISRKIKNYVLLEILNLGNKKNSKISKESSKTTHYMMYIILFFGVTTLVILEFKDTKSLGYILSIIFFTFVLWGLFLQYVKKGLKDIYLVLSDGENIFYFSKRELNKNKDFYIEETESGHKIIY